MPIKLNHTKEMKKINLEETKKEIVEKLKAKDPKIIINTINADFFVYTIISVTIVYFVGYFGFIFLIIALFRHKFHKEIYIPKKKKK